MSNAAPETGVIIVDHGSRREASNVMLLRAVEAFAVQSEWSIVEPAHMELAQPDIATAYRRCVDRGASRVVVFPYFLSPGRHWSEDIPNLVKAASTPFPETEWMVTAPFGMHPGMSEIMSDRIAHCLSAAEAGGGSCDVCQDNQACHLNSADRNDS